MDRTERLLDLVALLLDGAEPVSFADLREAFPDDYGGARESAERKLERDKAELLQLGVPLEFVPPGVDDEREVGGYRIDRAAFFLPDPRLLPEEAASLYAAGSAALAVRDFPFAQDLQHALRKLSLAGAAPAPQSAARSLLVVRPGDTERAPLLRALGDAVARRKRVHIRYDKFGAITERDVDPYGLAFRGGTWRIVGYCHLRKARRALLVLLDQHAGISAPAQRAPPEAVPGKAPAAGGKRTRQQLDAPERLRRLLLIVPAARRKPGIKVEELARELGLTPEELVEDIDLLGFVGRPPFSPDDLIDINVNERGRVSVMLDQSFSRPPQLTALEALALAAASQETAPADPAVVSALRKLTDKLPAKAQQLYAALAKRVAAATPPPPGTAHKPA